MNTDDNISAGTREAFLNVNATTNAIDYLESAAQFLEREDDFKWKWIALAVYHALYGFCVVALEHSNPDWVLSTRGGKDDEGAFCKHGNQTRWSKCKRRYIGRGKSAYRIEWVETDELPHEPSVPDDPFAWTKGKLIGFWTALARIQDRLWMGRYFHSMPVAINDEDLKAIQWLGIKVRNELIHFIPKHLGISIEGIQHGSLAALRAIESLVFKSNTIIDIRVDERDRIRKAIDRLRDALAGASG